MTYARMINQAMSLYEEKGSLEAYHFVCENADSASSANQAQIYNFKYCLAAASGFLQEAINYMCEAVEEKGFWYDYDYLMEDEDLTLLRDGAEFAEEFTRLAKLCKKHQQETQAQSKPILDWSPNEADQKSMMLVLHGDQQNAAMAKQDWQCAQALGVSLAVAQSSQVQVSDGYVWDDVEKAGAELLHHKKSLEAAGVPSEKIILCGFSSGGRTALFAVLQQLINPKALILVAPWLPELEEWSSNLRVLKESGISVGLICGDEDEDCFEETEKLFERLKEADVPVCFRICKGLDHDYPSDFSEILSEIVEFIG